MNDDEISELKRREEEKRQRALPPLTWQQIAEMLTWAESHVPPEQRRNRPRVHAANERP
jgi:hypothetical protein